MSRKLILASTMSMILAGADAFALGLGGLRTQSALNQPFVGEIDLHDVKPDEVDAVKVSIASQQAFDKAGLERYYYLTNLRFTPEVSPQGKPLIRISSRDPIREPYMDLLIEAVWPGGRLVKEYTVLLDPPVLTSRQTARVETPGAGAHSPAAAPPSGVGVTPSSAYLPAPGDGFPLYVGPIGSGAGLWRLAREHGPADATTAQTAMALYRNNQHAFVRGNINRLILGKTLVIPTRAELFALDPAAAERDYATALRGGPARREPITGIPPDALSRLRIAGATSETAPPAVSPTSAVPGAPSSAVPAPAMEQDLLRALETSESTRQEAVELRDRIKELETQLADIQTLLQLRNAELARAQAGEQPTDTSLPVSMPVPTPAPLDSELDGRLEPATVALPEGAPTPPVDTASVAPGDTQLTTEPPSTTEAGLLPVPVPTSSDAALLPVPQPEPAAAPPEPATAPTPPPQTPPPAAQSTVPAAEEDASTWHALLLPLAGFAAVTALGILVFSWVTARRRRREEAEGDEDDLSLDVFDLAEPIADSTPSRVTPESERPGAPVTLTKAEQPESELESVPVSDPLSRPITNTDDGDGADSALLPMSSLSNFDAETDEADVLSEADIYIAYGRHGEAQELLRNEMRRYPNRLDIKFKLAEAYAGTKDVRLLAELMQTIKAAGGDRAEPAQWKRLQSLAGSADSAGEMPVGANRTASDDATPVARRVPEPMLPDTLTDSQDLGLDDVFSLDISDIQRALPNSTEPSPAESATVANALRAGEPEHQAQPKFTDDFLRDLAPAAAPAFDDVHLDLDSFGDALTVPASRDKGVLRPEPARDLRTPADDGSELVLTLDEPRPALDDDLDSVFNDEPTLARNEFAGAKPSGSNPLPLLSPGQDEFNGVGLPPVQESVPTDLLSSQWQMDSGIWDETATKLDLARAYIEMDDAEAAREILGEVIAEGRDEQRAEAEALLRKLA